MNTTFGSQILLDVSNVFEIFLCNIQRILQIIQKMDLEYSYP